MAAVVGGVLYLFNMLPLDAMVKKVANILILMIVVVWAIRWLIAHVH
jgi:hypothetical protein